MFAVVQPEKVTTGAGGGARQKEVKCVEVVRVCAFEGEEEEKKRGKKEKKKERRKRCSSRVRSFSLRLNDEGNQATTINANKHADRSGSEEETERAVWCRVEILEKG